MAKELRTEDGKAVWIVQKVDDVEGHPKLRCLRPATEEDTEGQAYKTWVSNEGTEDTEGQLGRYGYITPEGTEDTEGQGYRVGFITPEGTEDTEGQAYRGWISPEPLDPEAGTYLAVIDEDDVEGQGSRFNF